MKSLRFRITATVTALFAVVLIAASLIFLGWFEGNLVGQVRADDNEELDRQQEILDNIANIAALDPTFVTVDEILNPQEEVGLLALIPDDGTFISIRNANGDVIADTAQSLGSLRDSDDSQTQGGPDPTLSLEEVFTAMETLPDFNDRLTDELPPETLEEFASAMRLLADMAAPVDADEALGASEDDPETAAALEEFSNNVMGIIFGTEAPSTTTGGRLITTERTMEIIGQPVTMVAESRVTSVDGALDAVRTVLWLSVPAILLLIAGLVWLATGRSLRPVDAITTRVETITSAQTGERVPVPDTGDEINHLATTMNSMLDRLEVTAAGQRQFVSDVSHELRTPAAVIRAEVEAALADPANDWAATGHSVLAEQSRLSALVDDLILLARADEGVESRRVDVDFDDLVRSAATRGWAIPVTITELEPVRLTGDPSQLGRIVQNLIANATRHAHSQVEVSLTRTGDEAVFVVDDDGKGVPAGDRDRVFDRFIRLDEGRERDAGGSGLGLAIVKEVAEAHGGSARSTNSPLGGARFEVRLQTA